MAYINPFDETTPSDADPASQGDDRIREIKAAVNERLSTVFSNWPDGDPLELAPGLIPAAGATIPVTVGLFAAIPVGAADGSLFYATDTKYLYLKAPFPTADDPSIWSAVGGNAAFGGDNMQGLLADRPGVPGMPGLLYYAHDTGQLFFAKDDLTWSEFVGSGGGGGGGEIEETFTDLNGQVLTGTASGPIAVGGAIQTDVNLVIEAGADLTTHIFLSLRARIRNPASAWVNQYTVQNHLYDSEANELPLEADNLQLGVNGVRLVETAGNKVLRVGLFITNIAGVAQNYEVEVVAYMLKVA